MPAWVRIHREGLVHDGVEISFGGRRLRIDFHALTGKAITVYGQTEITRDLMDARVTGAPTIYEANRVSLDDIASERPRLRYRKNGAVAEIECDFITGCDGFHGVRERSSFDQKVQRQSSNTSRDHRRRRPRGGKLRRPY